MVPVNESDPTCVYIYYDASGKVLYVGITSRGVTRSHEHARSKRWWDQTAGCHIEHFATRTEALARESFLIAAYKPPYNTQGITRRLTATELSNARERAGAAVDNKAFAFAEVFVVLEAAQAGDWPTAIRLWMALPPKLKRVTGCIRCRNRDWANGPMCKPCHADYLGGMTRTVRRELSNEHTTKDFPVTG